LRATAIALAILACSVVRAWGQSVSTNTNAAANPAPVTIAHNGETASSFSAAVYTYLVPDDRDYAQPTFTADRDWVHIEARYNYEDLDTVSMWVGYNFAGGEKLAWEFTPMLGGVSGETTGVAPGYKGSLSWWKLELYSEGEYLFDSDGSSESFFYNWSELTLAPWDWFRFGLVTQRTRLYDTERDIERGLLIGATYKIVDLAAYVFDLDESRPTVVLALALSW
jgi:hypothetical protein